MNVFVRKKDKKNGSGSSASLQDLDPADPLQEDKPMPSRSPSPTGHDSSNSEDDKHTNHLQSGEYADRVQALLTLLNDLHELRTTHFQLSIPSVAVIGNQSSGKSSLIESICGISVPRESGTCTRCPMRCEIRRTESSSRRGRRASWTAKISIEVSTLPDPTVTRFRSFGPATIHDPGAVELWILRAQAAILNPHLEPSMFESLSREAINNLRSDSANQSMLFFSEKLLKIVIEYAGATPLTFIDLPGIVHNIPDGAPPDTPDVIRRLVKNHIQHTDTIILVTIPAIDDIETQEAFKLAREVDPDNIRTLGVFTKSDLLQASSTNMMKRRLRDVDDGHRLDGGLGYFAVKLPDDSEREFGEARIQEMERELFETQQPWKAVKNRERLGVKNLVIHVGSLLADLVDARLPFLRREVDTALADTKLELSLLPPEPDWSKTKREVKLHLLLASFVQEHMSLTQHDIETYKKFAAEIVATKPPYGDSPTSYWTHIDETIRKCTTWELPGNTPYLALKSLISEFTARWKDPSQTCFTHVAERLASYLEDSLINEHFKEYPVLQEHVLQVTQTSIRDRSSSANLRLNSVLDLEQRVPFYTLIQDDYISAVNTWKNTINNYGYSGQYTLQTELMAKALAYYGISSKRFTDYVMLTIEAELKQDFSNTLHAILLDSISSSVSSPSIEELMAEDPGLEKRRAGLKEKASALDGILARLLEYDPDLVAASDLFTSPSSPGQPSSSATADNNWGFSGGKKKKKGKRLDPSI
ncbi:P-loop containing nucleoside triphosphate hydrolase protein [Flagelloscypha sp. PMI_526]|nr:P-loop containing nucleoside triphosphate hydrolase protein [Flagelloscypha sp. PMI_526]